MLGRLVGGAHAGQVRNFTALGLAVETLWVAGTAGLERGLHVKLDEIAVPEQRARARAIRAVGRNERTQHHHGRIDEQLGDLAHAPDVLAPVLGGKTQVVAEPVPHVVAVEHVGGDAAADQRALERAGQRALAGAGQAGEPQRHAAVPVQGFALRACDLPGVPADVGRGRSAHATHLTPRRPSARPWPGRVDHGHGDDHARARLRARLRRRSAQCGGAAPWSPTWRGGSGRRGSGSARGADLADCGVVVLEGAAEGVQASALGHEVEVVVVRGNEHRA